MVAEQLLAGLRDLIRKQAEAEFHDPERVEYEIQNMTVDRFLEMLAYMLTP